MLFSYRFHHLLLVSICILGFNMGFIWGFRWVGEEEGEGWQSVFRCRLGGLCRLVCRGRRVFRLLLGVRVEMGGIEVRCIFFFMLEVMTINHLLFYEIAKFIFNDLYFPHTWAPTLSFPAQARTSGPQPSPPPASPQQSP